MHLRCLIFIFWLSLIGGPVVTAATVVVVSSERSAAYLEAAEALVGELEKGGLPRQEVLHISAAEWSASGSLTPKLWVALGAQAADTLARAQLRTPVLVTLLPRVSFERSLRLIGRKSSPRFSALCLDQPLGRQLDLIRLALPEAHRIGVLWGPETKGQAPALKAAAMAKGLELVEADVGHDEALFPALKYALDGTDLLLALPDSRVYNSGSIQNILLASFRARVPMLAFSPAYVRAGALLAVYVTPAQIGRQAATMALTLLQGKSLPETPAYSRDFEVAVNEHVARSLGLTLDAHKLRQELRRMEGLP